MPAPLAPAPQQPTAQQPAQVQTAQARPQLRSRRLTLTLGPLGISYATDQVLWSEAASGAQGTNGASADAGATGAPQTPTPATDSGNQATTAQTSARSFGQALYEAWRRQAVEDTRAGPTYGPDAAVRQQESASARQDAGGSTEGQGVRGEATRQTTPGWRMRRALAAYVACAQSAGGRASLLCATA